MGKYEKEEMCSEKLAKRSKEVEQRMERTTEGRKEETAHRFSQEEAGNVQEGVDSSLLPQLPRHLAIEMEEKIKRHFALHDTEPLNEYDSSSTSSWERKKVKRGE